MACIGCLDDAEVELWITQGAELPPRTLTWIDPATDQPYQFTSSPHTFTLRIATPTGVVIKTTGIDGSNTAPNVQIAFTEDEAAIMLPPGKYVAQLWATRDSDGLEVEPARIMYGVRCAITEAAGVITGIDGGASSPGPTDIIDGGSTSPGPVDIFDGGS